MQNPIKTLATAVAAAAAVLLVGAAAVAAAGPTSDAVANALGLDRGEVQVLRHEGLSLAQIAERQGIDPQAVIDALKARWTERIQVRLEDGAISPDEAAQLREQLEVRARDLVYRVTPGGMQGAAVGAGPGHGSGSGTAPAAGTGQQPRLGGSTGVGPGPRGSGLGTGTCDGTGPYGPGRP